MVTDRLRVAPTAGAPAAPGLPALAGSAIFPASGPALLGSPAMVRPPWSLVAWLALCGGLMLAAPAPPEPPPMSAREKATLQRQADMLVRDTRRWQREHGDRTLPWDEAEGHLAIVIDDVGRELHLFEQLLALRHPLTFSVLPGSIYAPGVQLRLRGDRRRYREVMLHLPMEPAAPAKMHEGDEAHERFLLATDRSADLRAKVEAALWRVPAAVGVNNHMGSRLTRDTQAMDAVMATLAERPLYFLDSRTIAETKAESVARAAGVPALARDVFLDHDPSEAAIEAALMRAAELSRQRPAVAIAHPSAAVVEVLTRRLPELLEQGVSVYPVSRLVAARRAMARQGDRSAANRGFSPPVSRALVR